MGCGNKYIGKWVDEKLDGYCETIDGYPRCISAGGSHIDYKGFYKNGKYDGFGTEIRENND